MKLTQHFTLEEFIESDTATVRLGIDNTPPPRAIKNLQTTAELAEMIRVALGVPMYLTSGYRCEVLEKFLCQADFNRWCKDRSISADFTAWAMYFENKAHPRGQAFDFKAPAFGAPYKIVNFIAAKPELMEHIDRIIMEGNWVHVAWRDDPRHEVKTASFDAHGTPTYTMGLA